MQGHVYFFGSDGHVFAYRDHPSGTASPTFSLLGLAVTDAPIEAMVNGQDLREHAVLVAPSKSRVGSSSYPVVSFIFYPHTDMHRAAVRMPMPRIRPLPRALFARFDEQLVAASRGTLSLPDAARLFDQVRDVTSALIPPAPKLSRHVVRTLEMLAADPKVRLQTISRATGVTPGRLSHLFSHAIGMDMRRYRLWVKLRRSLGAADAGGTFDERARRAGFTDAAHLSRSISEVFGGTASQLGESLEFHSYATQGPAIGVESRFGAPVRATTAVQCDKVPDASERQAAPQP
jgi:AraC-like DNA-binding protein